MTPCKLVMLKSRMNGSTILPTSRSFLSQLSIENILGMHATRSLYCVSSLQSTLGACMVIKHEITTEVKQHAEDRGCLTPQAGTTGSCMPSSLKEYISPWSGTTELFQSN